MIFFEYFFVHCFQRSKVFYFYLEFFKDLLAGKCDFLLLGKIQRKKNRKISFKFLQRPNSFWALFSKYLLSENRGILKNDDLWEFFLIVFNDQKSVISIWSFFNNLLAGKCDFFYFWNENRDYFGKHFKWSLERKSWNFKNMFTKAKPVLKISFQEPRGSFRIFFSWSSNFYLFWMIKCLLFLFGVFFSWEPSGGKIWFLFWAKTVIFWKTFQRTS